MNDYFSYSLFIDVSDPLPGEPTEFASLYDAGAAIRSRWPDAVLDDEWTAPVSTPNAQGQYEPVAVGDYSKGQKFVYPDKESKCEPDVVRRMDLVCAILYRTPIGEPD